MPAGAEKRVSGFFDPAPKGVFEPWPKVLPPVGFENGDSAAGCFAPNGDSTAGFAVADASSRVGFVENDDSLGLADAKLPKPPPPEKELKPPPEAGVPLAPNGFAGVLDFPNAGPGVPKPDFPNWAPGVLGVPNEGAPG